MYFVPSNNVHAHRSLITVHLKVQDGTFRMVELWGILLCLLHHRANSPLHTSTDKILTVIAATNIQEDGDIERKTPLCYQVQHRFWALLTLLYLFQCYFLMQFVWSHYCCPWKACKFCTLGKFIDSMEQIQLFPPHLCMGFDQTWNPFIKIDSGISSCKVTFHYEQRLRNKSRALLCTVKWKELLRVQCVAGSCISSSTSTACLFCYCECFWVFF
jgi:hypothetical protein